jgi:DNA-directed RNA polymerase specialized sigma24 family protein
MTDTNHSITQVLSQLKGGDELAAQLIWERFFARVRGLAEKKLGTIPKRIVDDEDVALSAINALCAGARDGRFHQLQNRDDLWQILCMLTARKAASAWRKQTSRKEVGESQVSSRDSDQVRGMEYIASGSPDDAYVDTLSAMTCELLEGLDDRLREVAILKLQGYQNREVAEKIGRSTKSVERYLNTIRHEWDPGDQ